MTKNIVFDMGKVLLAFEPKEFLKKIFSQEDVISALEKELFEGPEWALVDADALSDEAVVLSVSMRIPQYAEQVKQAMEEWPGLLWQISGMEELLKDLKARGYRLYLLSNVFSRFQQYFSKYLIFSLLDGIVISGTEHIVKPTPELYEHLCRKYGLVPEECLFVDDKPVNIEMALRLGWKGHVFTDSADLRRWMETEGIL